MHRRRGRSTAGRAGDIWAVADVRTGLFAPLSRLTRHVRFTAPDIRLTSVPQRRATTGRLKHRSNVGEVMLRVQLPHRFPPRKHSKVDWCGKRRLSSFSKALISSRIPIGGDHDNRHGPPHSLPSWQQDRIGSRYGRKYFETT